MDLEILPEPTDEERHAIVEALRHEAAESRLPSPWRLAALKPDDLDRDTGSSPRPAVDG